MKYTGNFIQRVTSGVLLETASFVQDYHRIKSRLLQIGGNRDGEFAEYATIHLTEDDTRAIQINPCVDSPLELSQDEFSLDFDRIYQLRDNELLELPDEKQHQVFRTSSALQLHEFDWRTDTQFDHQFYITAHEAFRRENRGVEIYMTDGLTSVSNEERHPDENKNAYYRKLVTVEGATFVVIKTTNHVSSSHHFEPISWGGSGIFSRGVDVSHLAYRLGSGWSRWNSESTKQ